MNSDPHSPQKEGLINICYTCYDFTVVVSLASLLQNVSPDNLRRIQVFLIVGDVPEAEPAYEHCTHICDRFQVPISRFDFALLSFPFVEKGWPTWGGTHLAYARLFLPEILPDISRIIYLDTDTLITGCVASLFDEDLKGKCFGAVHSPGYTRISNPSFEAQSSLGTANSGVLLMDLELMRRKDLLSKVKGLKSDDILYADQCVLDRFLYEEITYLPLKYNLTSYYHRSTYRRFVRAHSSLRLCTKQEYKEAMRHPVVVHFNGSNLLRPWFKNSRSQFFNYWQNIAKETLNANVLLTEKKNQSSLIRVYQRMMHHLRFLPNWLFCMLDNMGREKD